MRVPIPIAIASCFIATASMWYFNTRDADFTTAPSDDQKIQVASQWKEKNIAPPSATPLSTDLQIKKETPAPPEQPIRPTPPPPPKSLPMGDLKQSPKLSEYGTLGSHGAPAMIRLALELEKKEAFQRALLAWERVLDTSQPNEDEINLASQAIRRLSAELPPWNPDSSTDITLTLHAGATLKDTQTLKHALKTTAEMITIASGHILKVRIKTAIGKGTPPKTPRIPIAIWFTRPAQKSRTAAGETPPLSFMANPKDQAILTSQCQAAVYALLSAHLTEATSYSDLPEYPAGVKPDELLNFYVTRLMWREFANSLKK